MAGYRDDGAGGGPVSAGSGTLRVLSEPQAGLAAIYALINGAKSSIDLTMYELIDTTAENDLTAAAKRGVDVRVILDAHLEKSRNTATYDYLKAHKVHVTWAASGVTYHQKTLTVDDKTSVIMTLNMASAGLRGHQGLRGHRHQRGRRRRRHRDVQRRLLAQEGHAA